MSGCERRVSGCERRVSGCERRVSGCERRVSGCERRERGCVGGVYTHTSSVAMTFTEPLVHQY